MLCICFVLAPLDNHEIVFGYESFTAALPSSRRQPCFPAFPAVARGAQFVSGCARRATVASVLTANVIRHGICGGLHRAAAHRIAIHPHLPGHMPSAERRLRRLPRLRLRLASRRQPRFVRGHCLSVFCSTVDCRSVYANSLCAAQGAACCAMVVF